jgi:hypothetical protein
MSFGWHQSKAFKPLPSFKCPSIIRWHTARLLLIAQLDHPLQPLRAVPSSPLVNLKWPTYKVVEKGINNKQMGTNTFKKSVSREVGWAKAARGGDSLKGVAKPQT